MITHRHGDTTFIINGGYTGDVILMVEPDQVMSESFGGIEKTSVIIPYDDIRGFVLAALKGKLVSMLESADDSDLESFFTRSVLE